MSSASLVGKTINNQYHVREIIAAGGMGTVYLVWDRYRKTFLAMKMLHLELAEDESIVSRFNREAAALKKLSHPNILQFFDYIQWDQSLLLFVEYIDGVTLKDVLTSQGRMSAAESLIYLKAVCAALGYAHHNSVIHCDIKPSNIMIDQGGMIYLTDFGIARHADSTATTFGPAGTPRYMAPEQIRNEAVSEQTDIYAFGATLFEMLAGQPPFTGKEAATTSAGKTLNERIRYAQLNLDAPDPVQFNPDISPALAQVILRTLRKAKSERYANTNELFDAVVQAAGVSHDSIRTRTKLQMDSSIEIATQRSSPQLASMHRVEEQFINTSSAEAGTAEQFDTLTETAVERLSYEQAYVHTESQQSATFSTKSRISVPYWAWFLVLLVLLVGVTVFLDLNSRRPAVTELATLPAQIAATPIPTQEPTAAITATLIPAHELTAAITADPTTQEPTAAPTDSPLAGPSLASWDAGRGVCQYVVQPGDSVFLIRDKFAESNPLAGFEALTEDDLRVQIWLSDGSTAQSREPFADETIDVLFIKQAAQCYVAP